MDITMDGNALVANAQTILNKIQPAKLCAVVKNNAYGHGIEFVCNTLKQYADYFAVGTLDEAKRAIQFGKEVLILLPILSVQDTIQAIKLGINLTVDSLQTLSIIKHASQQCVKTAKVHIKVDTGMSRLGFLYSQKSSWLPQLSKAIDNGCIDIKGVFSHFAAADTDKDFTHLQYTRFVSVCEYMQKALGSDQFVRHIVNSCGALDYNCYSMDMVRCGLALYGYGAPNLIAVKNVSATVLERKRIKAGQCVGYECAFTCANDTDIAVLDIGYAHGLSRVLSGNVVFHYNGRKLKQLGKICMAMSIVDCTGTNLQVGDKVTLIDAQCFPYPQGQYSVYELLCDLRQQ